MPIEDNRVSGSGGGVTSVNGQSGVVTLTAADVGAADAADVGQVTQGTAGAPLVITNATVINLNTVKDETLYLSAASDETIDLANFTGVKPEGKKLRIIVKGAFALLFQAGGNFIMNGDRRMVLDSAIEFYCDGANYTECPNEIA